MFAPGIINYNSLQVHECTVGCVAGACDWTAVSLTGLTGADECAVSLMGLTGADECAVSLMGLTGADECAVSLTGLTGVNECTVGCAAGACNSTALELTGADETITRGNARRKAAKIFFIVDVVRYY